MDYILVVAGLTGLFFGGEALVRGSVGVARYLAMSPLLIGLTIVGFGTSAPELLVSVDAALRGVPEIAIGNIVGSNIANILLIVGITCLVWPIRVPGLSLDRDLAVMVGGALVLVPMFSLSEIGRGLGALLLLALLAYLVHALRQPGETVMEQAGSPPAPPFYRSCIWVIAGLVILVLGARFLVNGSVGIAQSHGVSEAFIGLTIVAVGTSLPELATSVVAAFRRQSEIAIGNVIGSNIFNILGILATTAVIKPVPVDPRFLGFDLPIMIAVSVLFAGLLLTRPVLGRGIGAVLLIAYAAYIWSAQG